MMVTKKQPVVVEYELRLKVNSESLPTIIAVVTGTSTIIGLSVINYPDAQVPTPVAPPTALVGKRTNIAVTRNNPALPVEQWATSKILIERMDKKPATRDELRAALVAAGYAASTSNATLSKLLRAGKIAKVGDKFRAS